MRNRLQAFAFFALAAAGCGRGRAPAPAGPPPPTPMPPPVQLYYDNAGGIRDSLRVLIRDGDALANYWKQATSTQASPAPQPALDFGRDMAILVAAGRKTPDDQIHVDSLLVRPELNPDGRRVETLTIVVRSVEGCRRFRTEAFPVEIVRARKFDGPVKWEERKDPQCRDWPADR
jgi:hypothetical protein